MDRPRALDPPRRPLWLDRPWPLLVTKHAGPGAHKGTGTPQAIHSGNARTRVAARATGAQNRATGAAGRSQGGPSFEAPTEQPKPAGGGAGVSKADVDAVLAEMGGRIGGFGFNKDFDWDPEVVERHTAAIAGLGAKMRKRLDELAEANGTGAAALDDDVSDLIAELDTMRGRQRIFEKTGRDFPADQAARLSELEAEVQRRGLTPDHRLDNELLSMARRNMMRDLFDEIGYPMSRTPIESKREAAQSMRGAWETLEAVGRDGWFPQRLVDRMNEPHRQVTAGVLRDRGGYEPSTKRIHLSGDGFNRTRTAVHEFGHAIQYAHDAQRAEWGFLSKHADLSKTVERSSGSSERVWPKKDGGPWHERYLARQYNPKTGPSYDPWGDDGFEVFTVGLEALYGLHDRPPRRNTNRIEREHAEWTLGAMAVMAATEDRW